MVADDPVGSMRIGELARRTNVGVSTLRAWERRYALFDPQRTPAGHRLYDEDDVERARAVVRLVGEGLTVHRAVDRVAARGPGAVPDGEAAELLFTQALEVVDQGMWVVRDRRTRYANRRMVEILGRPLEEILAMDVLDLFEPGDLEALRGRIQQVRHGERVHFVQRLRRGDDATFVAEIDACPLLDHRGRYDGAVCAVEDITDRVEAEARARMCATLLGVFDEAALAATPDARISFANAAAERRLGWPVEALVGREVGVVSSGLDGVLTGQARRRLVDGHRVTRRHRILRCDGTAFNADVTAAAVLEADGATAGFVAVIREHASDQAARAPGPGRTGDPPR